MKDTSHKFPLTAARRLPCASLLLSAAAVIIYALPSTTTRLQYDRLAIAAGEIWRVLSSHWTHVSGDHLVWDVLTFVVLGTLCERLSRVRFYACVVGAAALIPVGLWITAPHIATYRGLSGIDSALFAFLAVTLLKDEIHGRRWGWVAALSVALLAFIAKVGYEVATGGTFFVDSSAAHMVPVPLAHCVGAAVGMTVGLMRIPNWAHGVWRDPRREDKAVPAKARGQARGTQHPWCRWRSSLAFPDAWAFPTVQETAGSSPILARVRVQRLSGGIEFIEEDELHSDTRLAVRYNTESEPNPDRTAAPISSETGHVGLRSPLVGRTGDPRVAQGVSSDGGDRSRAPAR